MGNADYPLELLSESNLDLKVSFTVISITEVVPTKCEDLLANAPLGGKLKVLFTVVLLSALVTAGTGKIVDIAPYSEQAAQQVTVIQGYPNPIVTQGSWDMFTLTVALDGIAYSGNFRAKRNFQATDFIVGDPIDATVDGRNLIIRRPGGKAEKAKVTRKAHT